MLKPGRSSDLAQKALRSHGNCELGTEYLKRDQAVVREVARKINRGHAASPERALEYVAVG